MHFSVKIKAKVIAQYRNHATIALFMNGKFTELFGVVTD
jgi:hypothetical protein